MKYDGLWVQQDEDVYRPSDDTFLLAQALVAQTRAGERVLEVGTGAGLVAMAAARRGARVVATDQNPLACRLAAANARENRLHVAVLRTDLLQGLKGPFDTVAFNPPYLPTAPEEVLPGPLNLAFDGGPDGNAVVLRFAAQLQDLDPRPPRVLVVHSSLSDPQALDAAMGTAGYACSIAMRQRLPYEELTVRRYRLAPDLRVAF